MIFFRRKKPSLLTRQSMIFLVVYNSFLFDPNLTLKYFIRLNMALVFMGIAEYLYIRKNLKTNDELFITISDIIYIFVTLILNIYNIIKFI